MITSSNGISAVWLSQEILEIWACLISVNTVNKNTDKNYMPCNFEMFFKMNTKILSFHMYLTIQLEYLMFKI